MDYFGGPVFYGDNQFVYRNYDYVSSSSEDGFLNEEEDYWASDDEWSDSSEHELEGEAIVGDVSFGETVVYVMGNDGVARPFVELADLGEQPNKCVELSEEQKTQAVQFGCECNLCKTSGCGKKDASEVDDVGGTCSCVASVVPNCGQATVTSDACESKVSGDEVDKIVTEGDGVCEKIDDVICSLNAMNDGVGGVSRDIFDDDDGLGVDEEAAGQPDFDADSVFGDVGDLTDDEESFKDAGETTEQCSDHVETCEMDDQCGDDDVASFAGSVSNLSYSGRCKFERRSAEDKLKTRKELKERVAKAQEEADLEKQTKLGYRMIGQFFNNMLGKGAVAAKEEEDVCAPREKIFRKVYDPNTGCDRFVETFRDIEPCSVRKACVDESYVTGDDASCRSMKKFRVENDDGSYCSKLVITKDEDVFDQECPVTEDVPLTVDVPLATLKYVMADDPVDETDIPVVGLTDPERSEPSAPEEPLTDDIFDMIPTLSYVLPSEDVPVDKALVPIGVMPTLDSMLPGDRGVPKSLLAENKLGIPVDFMNRFEPCYIKKNDEYEESIDEPVKKKTVIGPNVAPACSVDWVAVAGEGETVVFNDNVDLRYGDSGSGLYAYLYGVTGTQTFDNGSFGDPVEGVVKQGWYRCHVVVPPLPTQFTPNFSQLPGGGAAGMLAATVVSQAVASVDSQDPDGINWIPSVQWEAAQWDGIPRDICSMTNGEICSWLWPLSGNAMRGLRELYYSLNPFGDISNPTVAEIDNWNLEVIRHLRRLFGINTPVNGNRCLYLRAVWSDERKNSTVWDVNYPSGTCPSGSDPHCGDSFIPSALDQVPYLEGGPACGLTAGASGIVGVNTDIPWSIKLSRIMKQWICTEGPWAHAGPFFQRTEFGMSFLNQGGGTTFRLKSSGSLVNPCL